MNDKFVINQLELMRKDYMNKGNMKSQRIAAINYSIRAVKRSQNKSNSFWYGYLTCFLMIVLFLIAFYVNSLS